MTSLNYCLGALLDFQFAEWFGLIPCLTVDIAHIFGKPFTVDSTYLGAYAALRETYSVPASAASGLIVYSRALRVVAVETVKPPPIEAVASLGSPDVRKAPEFALPGYLLSEHLYCRRGLVLSVAEALDTSTEPRLKIARCRGIPILATPYEYGAEYYLALQTSLVFEKASQED